MLASDVKVAVELLRAGLAGAAANVEINLGSVKDAGYVQHVRSEAATFKRLPTPDYDSRLRLPTLVDLVQQPLPARLREEVRDDREPCARCVAPSPSSV